jgi:hypothetical protein
MIRCRYACAFVPLTCLMLGCSGGRWPRLTQGGRYEVSNPTPCRALVYTATENGVTRRYLGEVPSGGRAVVSVPAGSEGTRVVAMALYRDGTDCDSAGRLRIRPLRS